MQRLTVTAPDGVELAAYVGGKADGPGLVFLHGFNQCHLSWARQWTDPELVGNFRLLACDLRGHGASAMPVGRPWYYDDRIWADDLARVIQAAALRKPVLVAWSYAGRTVTDYVRVHGQDQIAGIVFVAAVTKSENVFWGPGMKHTKDMLSDDLMTNIAATRRFMRVCFAQPPSQDELETMLAYNMVIPAKVRASILDRPRNEGDLLPTLRLPVLVIHGEMDQVVLPAAGQFTASAVPGAKLSLYHDVAHAPHMEAPARFNREIADFVRAVNGQGA